MRCIGLLCLALASAGWTGAAPAKECSLRAEAAPADSRAAYTQLLESVSSSPFLQELTQRFGRPQSCRATFESGNISVRYTFAHGARLTARLTPAIESSEQVVELRDISAERGLELLKAAARAAYGAAGCGIDWTSPAEESDGSAGGRHETVFRGDTCNCQARIVYRHDAVAALVLRSAC